MDKNSEDLKHIRSMMERSTKFLSISGISGIVAGSAALAGSALIYLIAYLHLFSLTSNIQTDILIIASTVLIIAGMSFLYFSKQKAKKMNQLFWSSATKQILKDAGVPLVVGAAFCLILFLNDKSNLIASATLIFCGLACINAGARSFRDVKLLGTCLILLGICAGIWIQLGLLFWCLGFGVLFIIYGIVMYRKYDIVSSKND